MQTETIVVKIGTSSLTDGSGRLDPSLLEGHVASLIRLKRSGFRVVLVSSGAIAAGFHDLGLSGRPCTLAGKQAAAAVGQVHLVERYRKAFTAFGESCGQVLLTRSDFDQRTRYLNALNTLNYLLERGCVPVINENDSVAVDEIRWGDNDTLAAMVAGLLQARWLLLITDTDGVYTANPMDHPDAEKIPHLNRVDEALLNRLDDSRSAFGTGGMRSKLTAARKAARIGVRVYIGTARESAGWMHDVIDGKGTGTYLDALPRRVSRKEQWIAAHACPRGRLTVDGGAARALLESGGSLLPCGVVDVTGRFAAGEVVEVTGPGQLSLGRGVCRYSADLLRQVKGLQSHEALRLAPGCPEEVIHRDDWVRTGAESD
ncbi:glutamate 5-kinase [Melghirimyces profundicolus]|uniref:Glutamate 5-kinase n=1 Tax=Melghirimyces profundicolus TaxID=1242148 RepID=A0A2T6C8C0_9BACL|nr:glutamate 5-kinase [Melghirimyces profundicolus]PTX64549.1 glutamate 5-kinase [Melghirimyces profundicolus]